jgi:hypothetical protein
MVDRARAAGVTRRSPTGTIRDFCAPEIAGSCTRLTDFQGAVPWVVTGMVSSTLVGGSPPRPDGVPEPGTLALVVLPVARRRAI